MKILAVEDNALIVEFIARAGEAWNHEVEFAASGAEALSRISCQRFDIVLLDIFLPDALGYELIPKFKDLQPEIGIVTMTGYNTRELELKVKGQGILFYLTKPFKVEELKSILDHYQNKYPETWESAVGVAVSEDAGASPKAGKAVKPEKIIPMEDEDFSDF